MDTNRAANTNNPEPLVIDQSPHCSATELQRFGDLPHREQGIVWGGQHREMGHHGPAFGM